MAKRKRANENNVPDITPTGRVKGFSGAGVTGNFESQKEIDDHEDHEQMKRTAKTNPLGIKVFRHRGNSMR